MTAIEMMSYFPSDCGEFGECKLPHTLVVYIERILERIASNRACNSVFIVAQGNGQQQQEN